MRRIRSCTAAETAELAAYLARTDVAGYAAPLRDGAITASLVELVGRVEVGDTQTIFGNLGGIDAASVAHRAKFLVREAREVWSSRAGTDRIGLHRLEHLIIAERDGAVVDRKITLALSAGGLVIVDGNKRATAIYELADIDVVVAAFLIESAAGYPPLPMP